MVSNKRQEGSHLIPSAILLFNSYQSNRTIKSNCW